MRFNTPKTIGHGSMSWTVLYREMSGSLSTVLVSASHDKTTAWRQAQRHFKNRVIAIVPGNHNILTEKKMS